MNENDKARAAGEAARAEASPEEELGGLLDALSEEARGVLAAIENELAAEYAAATDALRRQAGGRDRKSLLAALRLTHQAKLTAARRRVMEECRSTGASLLRNRSAARRDLWRMQGLPHSAP